MFSVLPGNKCQSCLLDATLLFPGSFKGSEGFTWSKNFGKILFFLYNSIAIVIVIAHIGVVCSREAIMLSHGQAQAQLFCTPSSQSRST